MLIGGPDRSQMVGGGQTRTQHLGRLWTELYLDLTEALNFVLREREATGDGQINVRLRTLPQIAQDVRRLVEMLVEDIEESNQDGPGFEYCLRNEIPAELARFALQDVPEGSLTLVLGFFTALLSALPPHIFFQERIVTPLGAVFAAGVARFQRTKERPVADKILRLLQHLVARVGEYPPLGEIFSGEGFLVPCRALLCEIVEGEYRLDVAQAIILAAVEGNLIRGEAWNELLVSETCALIKSFGEASLDTFLSRFQFLDALARAAVQDEFIPAQIMSLYRQLFVDRIFATSLLGSSAHDGSRLLLWDLLGGLCHECPTSDLLLPLLSRAIRTFEMMPSIEMDRLRLLYTRLLQSGRLAHCFPSRRPSLWTESATVHRQRLDAIFALLPQMALSPFRDAETLSAYHRIHLMTVEGLLGDDLKVKLLPTTDNLPTPRVTRTAQFLDPAKNARLAQLVADCKGALSRYWDTLPEQNLEAIQLLAGWLAFSDSPEFYGELLAKESHSLLALLHRLVGMRPRLAHKENVLDGMSQLHLLHDPLDDSRWLPAVTGARNAAAQHTLNAYLLGHFFLRITAICQVRATRSATVIIYD